MSFVIFKVSCGQVVDELWEEQFITYDVCMI